MFAFFTSGPLSGLLTPADLATLAKVPLSSVYKWNSTGDGPVRTHVGRYVRYRLADVEQAAVGRMRELRATLSEQDSLVAKARREDVETRAAAITAGKADPGTVRKMAALETIATAERDAPVAEKIAEAKSIKAMDYIRDITPAWLSTLDTEEGNDLAEAPARVGRPTRFAARRRAIRGFVEAIRDDREIRSSTQQWQSSRKT